MVDSRDVRDWLVGFLRTGLRSDLFGLRRMAILSRPAAHFHAFWGEGECQIHALVSLYVQPLLQTFACRVLQPGSVEPSFSVWLEAAPGTGKRCLEQS